jgi:hypothetical protein
MWSQVGVIARGLRSIEQTAPKFGPSPDAPSLCRDPSPGVGALGWLDGSDDSTAFYSR